MLVRVFSGIAAGALARASHGSAGASDTGGNLDHDRVGVVPHGLTCEFEGESAGRQRWTES